jgi:hypothetical protein
MLQGQCENIQEHLYKFDRSRLLNSVEGERIIEDGEREEQDDARGRKADAKEKWSCLCPFHEREEMWGRP